MVRSTHSIVSTPLQAGKGASMQMLISLEEAPHFAMRKFAIAPGGSMPLHTNSVEHEQYVLGGCAKVIIGEAHYEAKKDDVLFIPAGVPHAYEVVGEEPYTFLCLVPKGNDEIRLVTSSCAC